MAHHKDGHDGKKEKRHEEMMKKEEHAMGKKHKLGHEKHHGMKKK